MQEDYVSFEVAKLLNEQGFDGEWHKHYWGYFPGKEFLTEGSFSPEYDCPAPTLQMAMKWLREVHNIFIQVELYSKYNDYCFELFQNTHRLILKQHETYNSYEEAVEAALEYTLKKLL